MFLFKYNTGRAQSWAERASLVRRTRSALTAARLQRGGGGRGVRRLGCRGGRGVRRLWCRGGRGARGLVYPGTNVLLNYHTALGAHTTTPPRLRLRPAVSHYQTHALLHYPTIPRLPHYYTSHIQYSTTKLQHTLDNASASAGKLYRQARARARRGRPRWERGRHRGGPGRRKV